MPSSQRKKNNKVSPGSRMRKLVGANVNLGVPWYLMAAYAYYELDTPFMDDADFDWLARELLHKWPHVQHRHKHLITEDDLRAGSLLTRDWPGLAMGAAEDLLRGLV